MYALKDNRAKSGIYVFTDFDGWAAGGSWDETDYTSGSSPGPSELYINDQAGPNDLTTGGTAHTFVLTSDAITQINNNNEIDMFFIHSKDLENTEPSNSDFIGRGQAGGDWYGGDLDLVLSADDDAVTYDANFFGANF